MNARIRPSHGHVAQPNAARSAFTLVELLITVALIAIAAAIAMPGFTSEGPLRVRAAVGVVRSDIEMAQVMSMTSPAEPVVIRFDPANDQYWLAYADTPDTPLSRPDTGEAYLVELGSDRAAAAKNISLSVADAPDNTLEFNTSGGLKDFTLNPVITIAGKNDSVELHIAPTTGRISEE